MLKSYFKGSHHTNDDNEYGRFCVCVDNSRVLRHFRVISNLLYKSCFIALYTQAICRCSIILFFYSCQPDKWEVKSATQKVRQTRSQRQSDEGGGGSIPSYVWLERTLCLDEVGSLSVWRSEWQIERLPRLADMNPKNWTIPPLNVCQYDNETKESMFKFSQIFLVKLGTYKHIHLNKILFVLTHKLPQRCPLLNKITHEPHVS